MRVGEAVEHLFDRDHLTGLVTTFENRALPTFLDRPGQVEARPVVVQNEIVPAVLAKARPREITAVTGRADEWLLHGRSTTLTERR